MTVLCGLPARFDNIISALDALGDDPKTLTVDHIKSRLLQEEQRSTMRLESLSIKSETSALVASRAPDDHRKDICAHCC